MIYMIPKIITVGHIYSKSVILTVVQKNYKSRRDRGKQKADTLPGDCHATLAMT